MARHYLDSLAEDVAVAKVQRAANPLIGCFLQGIQAWRIAPSMFRSREDELWSLLRTVDEELRRRGYRPQRMTPELTAQLAEIFGENNWVVKWTSLNESQRRSARALSDKHIVDITKPQDLLPARVVVDSRQLCWTLARRVVPGIN